MHYNGSFQSYFVHFFILLNLFICTFFALIAFNYDQQLSARPTIYDPITSDWLNPYNITRLGPKDATTLVDMIDFQFIVNNYPCHKSSQLDDEEENIFLLMFIHSAPNNLIKRNIIRQTWASLKNVSHFNIRTVFLLAKPENGHLQKSIKMESDTNGDIVQGNFVDSYHNLTYKYVMGLKWVSYYCKSAKFILKTDDDIFVDIIQLISFLRGYLVNSFPPKNFMSCYVIYKPIPKRSIKDKWKVSYEVRVHMKINLTINTNCFHFFCSKHSQEYPDARYPRYCYGWGVIMSPDVVFAVYKQSKNANFFWIDDVFVTGMLAAKVGINHVDLQPKLALNSDKVISWLKDDIITLPPLFIHPDLVTNFSSLYTFWNKSQLYHHLMQR